MKQIVIKGLTLIADRLTDNSLDTEGIQLIDAINEAINGWDSSPVIVRLNLTSFEITEPEEED